MRRVILMALVCSSMAEVRAEDPPQPKPAAVKAQKPDRAVLEKEFSEKLAGATLVGTFTTDGKTGSSPDRYRIVSARKLLGDDWIVTATMKLGGNELDIPIPIKVYWADDTPVMSLTDLTIPGMGTFTARVMFHGQRYAGTWQHGDHGGTFAGLIEPKAKPVEPAAPEKKPE